MQTNLSPNTKDLRPFLETSTRFERAMRDKCSLHICFLWIATLPTGRTDPTIQLLIKGLTQSIADRNTLWRYWL